MRQTFGLVLTVDTLHGVSRETIESVIEYSTAREAIEEGIWGSLTLIDLEDVPDGESALDVSLRLADDDPIERMYEEAFT